MRSRRRGVKIHDKNDHIEINVSEGTSIFVKQIKNRNKKKREPKREREREKDKPREEKKNNNE